VGLWRRFHRGPLLRGPAAARSTAAATVTPAGRSCKPAGAAPGATGSLPARARPHQYWRRTALAAG